MKQRFLFYILLSRAKAGCAVKEGNEKGQNNEATEKEEKGVPDLELQTAELIRSLIQVVHLPGDWILKACQWLEQDVAAEQSMTEMWPRGKLVRDGVPGYRPLPRDRLSRGFFEEVD